jgi:hypothetical protein
VSTKEHLDCREGCDGGHSHRWEVEPHPYDSDLDVFVCDDDETALQAALDAIEQRWDALVPGQQCVIKIRCNKAEQSDE